MVEKIKNFYELDAWKKGHNLVIDVYKISKNFPKEEMYGITSQIRRAASSVTANISEGFERYHFNDKTRFYYQARGSIGEVQNFLLLVKDLGLVNEVLYNKLTGEINDVRKLINGLINSIEKQK